MNFSQRVISKALAKLGLPYVWGGNGVQCWSAAGAVPTQRVAGCPEGYDCVGLVKSAAYESGAPDIRMTANAQTLYDRLPAPLVGEEFVLRFYGKGPDKIWHVAFDLGHGLRLEAAGGDHTTTTYLEALKRSAAVRVGFELRNDLVGIRSLAALEKFV